MVSSDSKCESGYSNEIEGMEDAVLTFPSSAPPPTTGNLLAKPIANIFTEKSVVVPQGRVITKTDVSLFFKIQNARSLKKAVAVNFGDLNL